MAQITAENFSFTYPVTGVKALDNITLSVPQGSYTLVCGQSGSGKSTLLRHLKPEIAPHGTVQGSLLLGTQPLSALSLTQSAQTIGFVAQDPENQLVTDKVFTELAFGLENLGITSGEIRHRVAEVATFFGLQNFFTKDINTLSGGSKQLLTLASVMVMQPQVLVLDEPTAQLDPIAASEFLAAVYKINRELGTTVIISEHRLEEIFPLCDQVVVLHGGQLRYTAPPAQLAARLLALPSPTAEPIYNALPAPIRVYTGATAHTVKTTQAINITTAPCPLTIRDGREWLAHHASPSAASVQFSQAPSTNAAPALSLNGVYFRYSKTGTDVLKAVDFSAYSGKISCILGSNGTGKSTLLGVAAGLFPAYEGGIKVLGKPLASYKNGALYQGALASLPQNPRLLFTKKTIGEDLNAYTPDAVILKALVDTLGIEPLLTRHPYDLSGGELQKVALAKILLHTPKVVLLDEPTKGLDAQYKKQLAGILTALKNTGTAIVIATHDVEFAANYADECSLLFGGEIIHTTHTRQFFSGNSFYTTGANRMARGINPGAITIQDVLDLC